jgi:hypothetical protein
MADCPHFRFDLPVPNRGAAASTRFGTHQAVGLSGFETVKGQHGYRRGSRRKNERLARVNDVST